MFLKWIHNTSYIFDHHIFPLRTMSSVTRSKKKLTNDKTATIKSTEKILKMDFELKENKSRLKVTNKRKNVDKQEIATDIQIKIENQSLDSMNNIKVEPELEIKQEPQTPPKKTRKHIKIEYEDASVDKVCYFINLLHILK